MNLQASIVTAGHSATIVFAGHRYKMPHALYSRVESRSTCTRQTPKLLGPESRPILSGMVDGLRQRKIAQLATQLAALAAPEDRDGNLDFVAQRYFDSRSDKPSTLANKQYRVGQFLDYVGGDRAPSSLSEEDVLAFLGQFGEGSLHAVATSVLPFLRWACANGWPSLESATPALKTNSRRRLRFLTDEEYSRVWHRIDEYASQPRTRSVTVDTIRLLLLVPMRAGEVATLRASEVSSCGRFLYLQDSKTGERVVPLSPYASDIVRMRRTYASGWRDYLFPSRDGKSHILPSSISHAWREKIAKPVGIPDVCLHVLRASYASKGLREGASLEVMRRILGHTTTHMTATYGHLADADLLATHVAVENSILQTKAMQQTFAFPSGEHHPDRAWSRLTSTQKHLLCLPGHHVVVKGPGQGQSARALVRAGLLKHIDSVFYERTKGGETLRKMKEKTLRA